MVVGEMVNQVDFVVIGGGPGGYHAAISAAQLGREVVLIEKEEMGGICLNKGCIPSKVLTAASAKLENCRKSSMFGIETGPAGINFESLKEYQRKTVANLKAGVEALCKANQVKIIKGNAFFLSDSRVGVEDGDKYELYEFRDAVIAAGARPGKLNGIQAGGKVNNEWEISFLDEIPEHLAIFGSSVIHLEIAMAFRAFGAEVTLMLPGEQLPFDSSVSKELSRIFKKEKIKLLKNCRIEEISEEKDSIQMIVNTDSKETAIEATHFFIESGMRPNSDSLGCSRIGIEMDKDGFIKVDEQCRTSVNGIYAIGDITGGPYLAAKAIRQGKVAAETACGQSSVADFRFLPSYAFTRPPIASAGLSEEQVVDAGLSIKTSQFPMAANGFSSMNGHRDGFAKIISEKETDVVLGIHIIGEGAHELIQGGILGLEMGAREEDFIFPAYPHPGLGEALLEAAEGLQEKAVHMKPAGKERRLSKVSQLASEAVEPFPASLK
ncbi:dihydrolipoyl dehydrogenase [Bacillus sp. B-jedd]|uniref:dihydrolipoyl dehydrogenase n=1 Tax=Bacillus sp. B-jedd TaxID=1476857 RepID=UPI000515644D|nr:dihydrolipoyl dehydrogenase [Bacillus sp. B-jedd]CEG27350.1 dihydrolipoamide dehydrogenase [Bacillus sp. B-jedd]